MQGNLEYLMSSLPYLSFTDAEEERIRVVSLFRKYAGPVSGQQNVLAIFEGEARKFLSADAFRILKEIRLEDIHGPAFRNGKNKVLASFAAYANGLKEGVRQLRLARKGHSEASAHKDPPLPLTPGNPLEEEIQLMKWQWDTLEELSIGHYADFGALCIYKLKLLLLLRWWGFDWEKGFEKFLAITETKQ